MAPQKRSSSHVTVPEKFVDIYAEPLSDSGEEEEEASGGGSIPTHKSQAPSGTMESDNSHPSKITKSRQPRPSRTKPAPSPPPHTNTNHERVIPQPKSKHDDLFAPNKRPKTNKKSYGSKSATSINSEPAASSSLQIPPLVDVARVPMPLLPFVAIPPVALASASKPSSPKGLLDFGSPPVQQVLDASRPELQVPPMPPDIKTTTTLPTFEMIPEIPFEPTQSSTLTMDGSQTFEGSLGEARNRSGSTSSLSSVDSGMDLGMTDAEKKAVMRDDTPRCPLCHSKVELAHLEEFSGGRPMGIRAQQRFCLEHKEREAQASAGAHGYPEIDWVDLRNRRIEQHIPYLTSVLRRKKPSYYLSKLDEMAFNTSQKKLQHYLKQGTIDLIKNGYYGPKGAEVLSNGISSRMSKPLSEALRKDKVVKATDVGGYISAVLLPELLVRLVMEDMKLKDEGKAREILAESTELGILLHGDNH